MFNRTQHLTLLGTTLTFAAICPEGQLRFYFHLPYSNFHLPLKNCIFYNVSWNMVLACESIFSRTSLDAKPQNLHPFSKVNLKYIQHTCPVGQARYSFHLPFSYDLQILLAQGKHQCRALGPLLSIFLDFNLYSRYIFFQNYHGSRRS